MEVNSIGNPEDIEDEVSASSISSVENKPNECESALSLTPVPIDESTMTLLSPQARNRLRAQLLAARCNPELCTLEADELANFTEVPLDFILSCESDPEFYKELNASILKRETLAHSAVISAVRRKALGGNIPAAKLHMEYTKNYQQTIKIETDTSNMSDEDFNRLYEQRRELLMNKNSAISITRIQTIID